MTKDAEIAALRAELLNQWEYNHAEHCGERGTYPHAGRCCWEMPAILAQGLREPVVLG